MNQEIFLDFGNALWKWTMPSLNIESSELHALFPLTSTQWNQAVGRVNKSPVGFIRVNGVPYVVGDASQRYGIPTKPLGASRYIPEYYGVGVCYAIVASIMQAYVATPKSKRPSIPIISKQITLYGSHAPGDIDYVPYMKSATIGNWDVEYMGHSFKFRIAQVYPFDEPLGGFSHFVLTNEGDPKKKNPIEKITTLVLDIGGKTTDSVPIDEDAQIDVSAMTSESTGINDVMDVFKKALRANNAQFFQNTDQIDIRRLNKAFMSGVYMGGGKRIPCHKEADEAANLLLNDINNIISRAGGLASYDAILLTGGGAVLMYDRLQTAYSDMPFYLAEADMDMAHFANVRGGRKLFTMLKRLDAL
ncbi:MAG: ParM/StbA family protein [Anaerolineae bacterium]|nr:ParM/StbA family protein [Anaerolineae bacterium]